MASGDCRESLSGQDLSQASGLQCRGAFGEHRHPSDNTVVSASAHYASLRSLRSARRLDQLPSPLYAARLVGLRVNSGAAPETSERYLKHSIHSEGGRSQQ
jgi:hypothetical protein